MSLFGKDKKPKTPEVQSPSTPKREQSAFHLPWKKDTPTFERRPHGGGTPPVKLLAGGSPESNTFNIPTSERSILRSTGHGLLRIVAFPVGVAFASVGGGAVVTILSGLVATGGTLSIPLATLGAIGVGSFVLGVKMIDFARGKK